MCTGREGCPPVIPTPTNTWVHCCNMTGLLCASCQYGKGVGGTKAKHSVEVELGGIRANNLYLGQ
eukprot:8928939-Ditylum_brightwellii.AAC.2